MKTVSTTSISPDHIGVSCNDVVDKGGVVVGDTIDITPDAEAILGDRDADAH